jgi:hypothetical protein
VAHADLERVRQRYGHRCGYCGVSEVDTGGTLTVDHYQPIAAGGEENEENLVYACFKCNQFKADFSPNAEDLARERRVLHPLYDDLAAYIRENRHSGELEPLNETGRFHIALLQLNRPPSLSIDFEEHWASLSPKSNAYWNPKTPNSGQSLLLRRSISRSYDSCLDYLLERAIRPIR